MTGHAGKLLINIYLVTDIMMHIFGAIYVEFIEEEM